jgi:hypothetical protein
MAMMWAIPVMKHGHGSLMTLHDEDDVWVPKLLFYSSISQVVELSSLNSLLLFVSC